VVSKTSKADIWLSSYDHLTDVGGQRGGCQQLSQRKGASISMAPGPHSSVSEEFLHSTILRPKKLFGSLNIVNPLLSMNEAWTDECAARKQLPW